MPQPQASTRLEQGHNAWRAWIWCGVAIACGILLRPDGGILLIALGLYLLFRLSRRSPERAHLFWAGVLVLAISLAPLVPWTIRNWRDFHRFQPLVPQSASDPGEFAPDGFDKWVRTWVADYVSTEEVYWQVPDDKLDLGVLPSRAFDSPAEREKTRAIFDAYAHTLVINPELNSQLTVLANAAHPPRSTALLRLAAGAARRRHVVASADGDAPVGFALVGLRRRHPILSDRRRCGAR